MASSLATTTIRLDAALKQRLARLAKKQKKAPHAWMREVLERSVREAEEDETFEATAAERLARFESTGVAVRWDEMREWMLQAARGEVSSPPRARKVRTKS